MEKEKLIKRTTRKSLGIKDSGRSTDYITPSFGHGCLFNCTYCYMKRNKQDGLSVATNIDQILNKVNKHCETADVEKPNQTHPYYITYDIGCNEDLSLHLKYYDWQKMFNFFKNHPRAMASFATKYVNEDLLEYNPEKKVRIRFSLMPQKYSSILEPKTTPIDLRIKAIDRFIAAGYDVHINFSPVIVEDDWLVEYAELFRQVQGIVENKDKVRCEVIFLTHNENKHKYNLDKNLPGEDMLWKPEIQEPKVSQYGGDNLRYKHDIKRTYISQFKELHKSIIPWNTIRYIF